MVQFNLPENAKVLKGNYFKDITGSKNIKKINIYRWDPDKKQNPKIDTFEFSGRLNCTINKLFLLVEMIEPH